jgi:hypothetical protein
MSGILLFNKANIDVQFLMYTFTIRSSSKSESESDFGQSLVVLIEG